MTPKVFVQIPRPMLAPVEITATAIISDDDGKFFTEEVSGWSSHLDEDRPLRGLCLNLNDNYEIIVPFKEIRKFVAYMDAAGL